jgi:purine-nucleoside phosphorylase
MSVYAPWQRKIDDLSEAPLRTALTVRQHRHVHRSGTGEALSSEERQSSFDEMAEIALDTAIADPAL